MGQIQGFSKDKLKKSEDKDDSAVAASSSKPTTAQASASTGTAKPQSDSTQVSNVPAPDPSMDRATADIMRLISGDPEMVQKLVVAMTARKHMEQVAELQVRQRLYCPAHALLPCLTPVPADAVSLGVDGHSMLKNRRLSGLSLLCHRRRLLARRVRVCRRYVCACVCACVWRRVAAISGFHSFFVRQLIAAVDQSLAGESPAKLKKKRKKKLKTKRLKAGKAAAGDDDENSEATAKTKKKKQGKVKTKRAKSKKRTAHHSLSPASSSHQFAVDGRQDSPGAMPLLSLRQASDDAELARAAAANYRDLLEQYKRNVDGVQSADVRHARAEAVRLQQLAEERARQAERRRAEEAAAETARQELEAKAREAALRREVEAQIRHELAAEREAQRKALAEAQALQQAALAAAQARAEADSAARRAADATHVDRRGRRGSLDTVGSGRGHHRSRRSGGSRHGSRDRDRDRDREHGHRHRHGSHRRRSRESGGGTDSDSSSAASDDAWDIGLDASALLAGVPVAGGETLLPVAEEGSTQGRTGQPDPATVEVEMQLKIRSMEARVSEAQSQVDLLTHMFTRDEQSPHQEAALRDMLKRQQRAVAKYQARLAFARIEAMKLKQQAAAGARQRIENGEGSSPVPRGASLSADSQPASPLAAPKQAWTPSSPAASVGDAAAGAGAASAAASAAAATAARIAAEVAQRSRGGSFGVAPGSVTSTVAAAASQAQPRFTSGHGSRYAPRQAPAATASLSAAPGVAAVRSESVNRSPGYGPAAARYGTLCNLINDAPCTHSV